MSTEQFGRFFLPGLSEVHPDVLDAIARPVIPHRGQKMVELLKQLNQGLQQLFRTDRNVLIGTCSATAFMEMAVRCGVRRRSLCLIGGSYGERFAGITESVGLDVVRLNVPLGRTIEPDMLKDALRRSKVDAVTLVHSETSTGALAPLEQLAAVVNEFDDVLLLVDGVTSIGASPVETDSWGVDYMFTASHGALGLPPGLALAAASERMCERAKSIPDRGAVLDLVAFQDAAEAFQPTYTPAIPFLYGLEKQLSRIDESGGIEGRWDRHDAIRGALEDWAANEGGDKGFGFLPHAGRRSWTVSCLTVPKGTLGRTLARTLEAEGFSIGSGYGKLKQTTIRIGHMGDHSVDELFALLDVLGALGASVQPE